MATYMDLEDLAKRIRDACLETVLQEYEDAGVQGLCAEGRCEAAVGALRTLDLAPLLREFQHPSAHMVVRRQAIRLTLVHQGSRAQDKMYFQRLDNSRRAN